jgi:hypothetical protein
MKLFNAEGESNAAKVLITRDASFHDWCQFKKKSFLFVVDAGTD